MPFKTKKKLRTLPPVAAASAVRIPKLKEKFAMSLSGFDVSAKSQDPVILIPVTALKAMPLFWNFFITGLPTATRFLCLKTCKILFKNLEQQNLQANRFYA